MCAIICSMCSLIYVPNSINEAAIKVHVCHISIAVLVLFTQTVQTLCRMVPNLSIIARRLSTGGFKRKLRESA